MATNLLQPILLSNATYAYQNTNVIVASRRTRPLWFDGRFLSARDLQRDQQYFLQRQADFGQAAGFGVIHGLQVDRQGLPPDAETIIIRAGQGLTPGGDLVTISTDLTVRISDLVTEQNLEVQFGISEQPTDLARTRTGLFVIALRPVEFTANPIAVYPASIQGTKTTKDGNVVEATAVSLVPYPAPITNFDATTRQAATARQIFVLGNTGQLSDSLLPIAMISIQLDAIEWVDNWMVRRDGGPASSNLRLGLPDPVTQQAFILQYDAMLQQAVAPYIAKNVPASFAASGYLQALPPSGRLPIGSINFDNFTQLYFPPQTNVQLSLVPDDELAALIEDSLSLPPIDLTLPASAYADLSVFVLVPVARASFAAAAATVTPTPLTGAVPQILSNPTPASLIGFFQSVAAPASTGTTSAASAAWKTIVGSNVYGFYVRRRSAPIFVNLNPEATFTVLTFTPPSTLTATVAPSAATGIVSFLDGSNTIGTATLSGGTATLVAAPFAVGAHSLTAVYQGDDNFATSTSPAVNQVVNATTPPPHGDPRTT